MRDGGLGQGNSDPGVREGRGAGAKEFGSGSRVGWGD